MRARADRCRGQGGFSLLEALIGLWIVGALVIVGLAAMSTMSHASAAHRQRSLAEVELTRFAEKVLLMGYTPCNQLTLATYADPYTPSRGDASATVTAVEFWLPATDGSDYSQTFTGGVGSCPPGGDRGVQRLTLRVAVGNSPGAVLETQLVKGDW